MTNKCIICQDDIPTTISIDNKVIQLGKKRSKCLKCSPYVPMSKKLIRKQCKKCGKQFSHKINNGKVTFYSKDRQYCLDCSPLKLQKDYPHKYYCPQCKQVLTKQDFRWHNKRIDVRHDSQCKQCCKKNEKQIRLQKKQKWVNYAGGKCSNCGYNNCLAALEFHHADPTQKDPNFPKLITSNNDEQIKQELDKCILLCANCHREIHNN